MKVGVMLLVGGLSCIALVACEKQAKAPPPQGQAQARIDINKGHPPKDDCKGADTQIRVVVIDVTDVKNLKANQYEGKTDKDGNAPDTSTLKPITPPYPNQLSVDAQPYLKKSGDIMLVQLKLPAGDSFSPANTVLTEDPPPENGAMFCLKKAPSSPPPSPPLPANVANFYVHYLDGAANGVTGHYTFESLPLNGHAAIRVPVDPEVTNDG